MSKKGIKLPPRFSGTRIGEEEPTSNINDFIGLNKEGGYPIGGSYAAMKSSKTNLELTSEVASDTSAMMSMMHDLMRSQREVIDRLTTIEASVASIRSEFGKPTVFSGYHARRNNTHVPDNRVSPNEKRILSDGIADNGYVGVGNRIVTSISDAHTGRFDEGDDEEDHEDGHEDRQNTPTKECVPEHSRSCSAISSDQESIEERLSNVMRPKGLEKVSERTYGGISEDKYLSTFFMQVMDLYANLVVSLCNAVQRKCEEERNIVYTTDASSQYTRIRRILSTMSKHDSFNASIPDKKDAGHRLVAHALRRREKDQYGVVNGYTFLSMARNSVSAGVFRTFCNLLLHLKKVPEILPQPSMTIVETIGINVCDDKGNIMVDYDRIVEASKPRYVENSVSKMITYGQISNYVNCRLSGKDPKTSLEDVASVVADSMTKATSKALGLSVSRLSGSGLTINIAPRKMEAIKLRPCAGPRAMKEVRK